MKITIIYIPVYEINPKLNNSRKSVKHQKYDTPILQSKLNNAPGNYKYICCSGILETMYTTEACVYDPRERNDNNTALTCLHVYKYQHEVV